MADMSDDSKPYDEADFDPQEPNLEKPAVVCTGGWGAPSDAFENIAPGVTEYAAARDEAVKRLVRESVWALPAGYDTDVWKPRRDGPPLRTGDRVAFVDIDGDRTEGIAHVDSAIEWNRKRDHETRIAIIPDGEPMQYGRDFTLGDRHVCDDTCSVGPFAPIPPDEALTHSQIIHRRIYARLRELGVLPVYPLPDSPFDEEASNADRGGIIHGGKQPAWMVDVGLVEPEPETPQQRALPRPSTTPPPWADNPAGQRRPTKTRNHRRVK